MQTITYIFTCNRVGDVRGNVKNRFDLLYSDESDILIRKKITNSTKNILDIIFIGFIST